MTDIMQMRPLKWFEDVDLAPRCSPERDPKKRLFGEDASLATHKPLGEQPAAASAEADAQQLPQQQPPESFPHNDDDFLDLVWKIQGSRLQDQCGRAPDVSLPPIVPPLEQKSPSRAKLAGRSTTSLPPLEHGTPVRLRGSTAALRKASEGQAASAAAPNPALNSKVKSALDFIKSLDLESVTDESPSPSQNATAGKDAVIREVTTVEIPLLADELSLPVDLDMNRDLGDSASRRSVKRNLNSEFSAQDKVSPEEGKAEEEEEESNIMDILREFGRDKKQLLPRRATSPHTGPTSVGQGMPTLSPGSPSRRSKSSHDALKKRTSSSGSTGPNLPRHHSISNVDCAPLGSSGSELKRASSSQGGSHKAPADSSPLRRSSSRHDNCFPPDRSPSAWEAEERRKKEAKKEAKKKDTKKSSSSATSLPAKPASAPSEGAKKSESRKLLPLIPPFLGGTAAKKASKSSIASEKKPSKDKDKGSTGDMAKLPATTEIVLTMRPRNTREADASKSPARQKAPASREASPMKRSFSSPGRISADEKASTTSNHGRPASRSASRSQSPKKENLLRQPQRHPNQHHPAPAPSQQQQQQQQQQQGHPQKSHQPSRSPAKSPGEQRKPPLTRSGGVTSLTREGRSKTVSAAPRSRRSGDRGDRGGEAPIVEIVDADAVLGLSWDESLDRSYDTGSSTLDRSVDDAIAAMELVAQRLSNRVASNDDEEVIAALEVVSRYHETVKTHSPARAKKNSLAAAAAAAAAANSAVPPHSSICGETLLI